MLYTHSFSTGLTKLPEPIYIELLWFIVSHSTISVKTKQNTKHLHAKPPAFSPRNIISPARGDG